MCQASVLSVLLYGSDKHLQHQNGSTTKQTWKYNHAQNANRYDAALPKVASTGLAIYSLSPLETISTSLWASLHHRFPVTVCFQSCQLSVHILFISSRVLSIHLCLGCPLLLFPGTTMSIIFLERLSSSPDGSIPI